MPMLRLMELTAKVSGSQESTMRSRLAPCGSKSIAVERSAPLVTRGRTRIPNAEAVSSVSTMWK